MAPYTPSATTSIFRFTSGWPIVWTARPFRPPASRRSLDDDDRIGVRMSDIRLAWLVLMLAGAGCSRGPAAVPPPYIDPDGAADSAIEKYDADHDGALSKKELAKCPAILSKLAAYDQNANGSVEREEI